MVSGDEVVVDWSAGEAAEWSLSAGAAVPVLCEAAAVAELSETPVLVEAAAVVELADVPAVDAPLPGLGWAPVLVGGGRMVLAELVEELEPPELEAPVCDAPVEPAEAPPPPEPPPEGLVFLSGS